jgi:hypothetical protein
MGKSAFDKMTALDLVFAERVLQFAQLARPVDESEAAGFVDHLARRHDEVDTVGLRPLQDRVEDRAFQIKIGIG